MSSIDAAERTVTVEPGIINQDLKDALAPHGLSYPPDPGSVGISSIGGNVATNAGGLCCVKYGVTGDAVLVAGIPVLVGVGMGERPGALAFAGIALALIAVVLVSKESPDETTGEVAGGREMRFTRTVAWLTVGSGIAFAFASGRFQ
mgnify:CR=1 FL=1